MDSLNLNRQEKSDALARLQNNSDFHVLRDWMNVQFEAHRNELENPSNPQLNVTQGRVATYRDIFNHLHENEHRPNPRQI